MSSGPAPLVAAVVALLAAGFALAWWRGRRQLIKLRTALRPKPSDLENLQLAWTDS
jgi:hypothetical protein